MPLPGTGGSQYVSVSFPRLRGKAPGPVRQPAACEHSPPKGLRHFSRMRDSDDKGVRQPMPCKVLAVSPFRDRRFPCSEAKALRGACLRSDLDLVAYVHLKSAWWTKDAEESTISCAQVTPVLPVPGR